MPEFTVLHLAFDVHMRELDATQNYPYAMKVHGRSLSVTKQMNARRGAMEFVGHCPPKVYQPRALRGVSTDATSLREQWTFGDHHYSNNPVMGSFDVGGDF